MGPFVLFDLILRFGVSFMQAAAFNESSPGSKLEKGLFIITLIVIVPVLVFLIFLAKFIYNRTLGKKLRKTIAEEHRNEAEDYEKAGKFVSAAHVYEKKLKDYRKAASLYEKGGDHTQAALLYNILGMPDKAKEMYERAGDFEEAAEVALMDGNFDEAATLYDKAGKKIDVAKVMRQAGKTIYAVKAYREAKEYKKAAMLLNEEGLLKEAAEMFGFHLYDKKLGSSTIEDFYTYALLLEKSGSEPRAIEIFTEIYGVDPSFKNVKEKIESMIPATGEKEEVPEGKTALRSFIRSGRIEPVYSLKLWVQILKSLPKAYGTGWPVGLLSPDNIMVDARNNISFLKRIQPPLYAPPEITKGVELDETADIYSAGVILFEMLTGGLEGLGFVRVTAVVDDVPEWLDEVVIKCIKKVREDRYQSIQDIFTDLKKLSRERQIEGEASPAA